VTLVLINVLCLRITIYHIHRVSKNVPPMVCYNFDTNEQILIFLAAMLPIK